MQTEIKLSEGATRLYETVKNAPIVSPHGHCDPNWFAEDENFRDPAELIIIPDHYVLRMLYSQGISLEDLGVGVAVEQRDPRAIFHLFAANYNLFLGTPSRVWIDFMLKNEFGITKPLSPENADLVYDHLDVMLRSAPFRPRAMFERFGIEILATTDAANDNLDAHRKIRAGWSDRVIPTFRPDATLDPLDPRFQDELVALAAGTDIDISSYDAYLDALRKRRLVFKELGATASDHAIEHLLTHWLDPKEVRSLFDSILKGRASRAEKRMFYGHMLCEMAQMSADDGLVMQLHAGSRRNTNHMLFESHGRDIGADIPVATDWVRGLEPLLNRVGNDPRFRLIAFTLDESSYARELAPMAGHWPALRIGPPWWFHDSPNGIARYFDQVVETAGYANLAGFNDDTRAFMSIPARHDLWRRAVAIHLDIQISRGLFGPADGERLAQLLATDLARDAYRLNR